jgi:hypothetical protein
MYVVVNKMIIFGLSRGDNKNKNTIKNKKDPTFDG